MDVTYLWFSMVVLLVAVFIISWMKTDTRDTLDSRIFSVVVTSAISIFISILVCGILIVPLVIIRALLLG